MFVYRCPLGRQAHSRAGRLALLRKRVFREEADRAPSVLPGGHRRTTKGPISQYAENPGQELSGWK